MALAARSAEPPVTVTPRETDALLANPGMGWQTFHRFADEDRKHCVPDFEDLLFRGRHFRLIRELGKRYNGHPGLDLIDIGSVDL
jgi:hypothetical protein